MEQSRLAHKPSFASLWSRIRQRVRFSGGSTAANGGLARSTSPRLSADREPWSGIAGWLRRMHAQAELLSQEPVRKEK